MRNKELKMKLGQLQEEISKASLSVSADLCNNYKSIILETDQKKLTFMRLILEEHQKFSSDKCFICFISDCPHYI